ncbi:XRE family transcriptional regulator [Chitinibacter sp. GC72]|uniref:XRE family transcriptional regulator n=1 Tax=Chitinibacter sp. GC72 TaxID=1526917 RepID=UPI0012FA18D1|nr:XRE family transcriptional regulator [Chitinibacter sp. GC72]
MLTPFGKYLRKLRIDHGKLLKSMADSLKVTSSYLSAVEMGKKAVPDSWIGEIAAEYQLDDSEQKKLKNLAEMSKPEFKVQVPKEASDIARETVAVFARKAASLDDEAFRKLLELLKKGE